MSADLYFIKATNWERKETARFLVTGLFSIAEQRVLDYLPAGFKVVDQRLITVGVEADVFTEVS